MPKKTIVFDFDANDTLMLAELEAFIAKTKAEIPAEYHDKVRFSVRGESTWGISLTYERLETDEEEAKRIADEKSWRRVHEKNERELYERLKAKYENNPQR